MHASSNYMSQIHKKSSALSACLSDSCNTLSMEKCEKYNTLGTFCERITVNITLKNSQSYKDNKNEEEEVENKWEWEVSEAVQMV